MKETKPKKAYERTEAEAAIVSGIRERKKARPPAPHLKMDFDAESRVNETHFDHPDQTTGSALLMYELATDDARFCASGPRGLPSFATW